MWKNMVKPDRPQTFHAQYMLDNLGYIHILRIYKFYCFFHNKSDYAKAPQYYVYKYITYLVCPKLKTT